MTRKIGATIGRTKTIDKLYHYLVHNGPAHPMRIMADTGISRSTVERAAFAWPNLFVKHTRRNPITNRRMVEYDVYREER